MTRAVTRLNATLRGKLLLSLTLVTALLTSAVLLVVQYRVRVHERDGIAAALRASVSTFASVQEQRDMTLERSTALLATLPPLKAVMTSEHPATIQDASTTFWELSGSQLFVLAERMGRVAALHTAVPGIDATVAQSLIDRALARGASRAWWLAGDRLFHVFLQPVYFGPPAAGQAIGMLAVGYAIDAATTTDLTRVASADLAFSYEGRLATTTLPPAQRDGLTAHAATVTPAGAIEEIRLGGERFLATSTQLSEAGAPLVTLTFVKSFDQATAFLTNLNRLIVVVAIIAIAAGALLVFFVSTTVTRPLDRLLSGVRALERGDFSYPLDRRGSDEVAALTAAFDAMRTHLHDAQGRLLEAEQLATIGRMASTISHDLRHPLTAVLAYAEFLAEANLSEAQRRDFFEEIRIAVDRMMDEINSLLGFSKESQAPQPTHAAVGEVIERAIRAVKALPDYEGVSIALTQGEECVGWFDPGKFERVMLNLLFNAAEVVPREGGRIEVACCASNGGTEVRVADNGPGIPEAIADSLFRPFVSYGKEKGIGLGLTVVQNIMQQHHGEVSIERTGANGTVFRLFFPAHRQAAPDDQVAA